MDTLPDGYSPAGRAPDTNMMSNQPPLTAHRTAKRSLDLLVAIMILGSLWWLLAAIWLLIRFDSPGPGLIFQDRVGLNGKLFKCIKFRTMQMGTPTMPTHSVNSSAVTRVGRLLRSTKLDELPQVWNILFNQMSLVGPRPSLPTQTDLIRARKQAGVLSILPGITGLAQTHQIDMSDPSALVGWDSKYLANQSIYLDISIMFATLFGAGRGDKIAPLA